MDGRIRNIKKGRKKKKHSHSETYTVDEKERCNKLEMQQKKIYTRNTTEEEKKREENAKDIDIAYTQNH